jgi:hypothetical protein
VLGRAPRRAEGLRLYYRIAMVAGAGTLLADDALKRIDAHAFFLWRVTIRSSSSSLRRGGSC